MRVLVFSERLRLPLDEGFKNTTISLARALRQNHDVLALTTFGDDIASEGVRNVAANKLLLSDDLRRAVRAFQPDVVLYIPTASATPFAMVRTRVLRSYAPQARTAMLALQPRSYDPLTRLVIRLIKPPLVVVQSGEMAALLASLGCRVARMKGGVDAERDQPSQQTEHHDAYRLVTSPIGFRLREQRDARVTALADAAENVHDLSVGAALVGAHIDHGVAFG